MAMDTVVQCRYMWVYTRHDRNVRRDVAMSWQLRPARRARSVMTNTHTTECRDTPYTDAHVTHEHVACVCSSHKAMVAQVNPPHTQLCPWPCALDALDVRGKQNLARKRCGPAHTRACSKVVFTVKVLRKGGQTTGPVHTFTRHPPCFTLKRHVSRDTALPCMMYPSTTI